MPGRSKEHRERIKFRDVANAAREEAMRTGKMVTVTTRGTIRVNDNEHQVYPAKADAAAKREAIKRGEDYVVPVRAPVVKEAKPNPTELTIALKGMMRVAARSRENWARQQAAIGFPLERDCNA